MYLPSQFASTEPADAVALMRAHPFAALISTDDAGFPFVTRLPLHLTEKATTDGAAAFVLLGHVARPNPHWRYLESRRAALACFLGPHAYLSPKVYPDLARVPTWNYVTVECRVTAAVIHDDGAKDLLLKKLIGDHEPGYATQWRGLPDSYTGKMLHGIVAFELAVEDLQCKLKVNQHRAESFEAQRALYAGGTENERGLVAWMDRLAERR